jgi:hypothetical protein
MTTNYTSAKNKTYLAKTFKDSLGFTNIYNTGYVFIGKPLEWANTSNIDSISCTVQDEKSIWNEMIAAKLINYSDLEIVSPRLNWTANKVYQQYDDIALLSDLVVADIDKNQEAMYVYNSEGNVYKCLSNNLSANSTIEPTGTYTSANGFIKTPDSYVWKYLYNIKASNKFLTLDYIPVPSAIDMSTTSTDYDMNESSLVDGSVNLIIVTHGGSGYVHTTITTPFSSGQSYLSVPNTINMIENMEVSGTGIINGTYITNVSSFENKIYLSYPTTSSGNTFDILTRISIDGDGKDLSASAVLSGNTLQKILIISDGSNYSKVNVSIYGTATSNVANARAVLSVKNGHGYVPSIELLSSNVMIVKRIGDVDSTEGGILSTDYAFRQYGLLVNPHIYGEFEDVVYTSANSVISQTLDVTVATGSNYTQFEYVYQGSQSSPYFTGYVLSQTSTVVKLINTYGTIDVGSVLKGSVISRPVVSYKTPEFQPYTGDILYVDNVSAISRSDGQAEEIKFIIKF